MVLATVVVQAAQMVAKAMTAEVPSEAVAVARWMSSASHSRHNPCPGRSRCTLLLRRRRRSSHRSHNVDCAGTN